MSNSDPAWSPDPPNEEGMWWLYGDAEFGTMGGNYSGTFPPEKRLHVVELRTMGSGKNAHLYGLCHGRIIPLKPFDRDNRKPGYVGVWQKAILPTLPKET